MFSFLAAEDDKAENGGREATLKGRFTGFSRSHFKVVSQYVCKK